MQTPTFEALQQKADEATFERRALAVDKERAIAENELANKTELARREKQLIAEEAENARDRATGLAEAQQIEAAAEAERIRTVESAKAEAESGAYRDLPRPAAGGAAGPGRARTGGQARHDRASERHARSARDRCLASSGKAPGTRPAR